MKDKTDITNFIREALRQNSSRTIDEIDVSQGLYEYIATSIEFIKVMVEIEEHYGIEFSNEELALKTNGTVAALIDDVFQKS